MKSRVLAWSAVLAFLPLVGYGAQAAPEPPGAVSVVVGVSPERIWPYTTDDLVTPSDPVNLIFPNADPRALRQALMALDGNRTAYGFPSSFPFNCTWADAMGNEQAAWAEAKGWTGGDVQLACGPYDALRFHLRLFRQGGFTLGGAHFEMMIPNTADHQVLSWEVAEKLVAVDLLRSGWLSAPPSETAPLITTGFQKTILRALYNGLLANPAMIALLQGIGMPTSNLPPGDVRIPTDGKAKVLFANVPFDPVQEQISAEQVLVYNQVIPKPFCSGPTDFVLVQGPVHFAMEVHTNPSGFYSRGYTIAGALNVTPVNPFTGAPSGPTVQAIVSEDHRAQLTNQYSETTQIVLRNLLGEPLQSLSAVLKAGHQDSYVVNEECGAN
ncbi:MAG TPA: hypothetical protein VFM88_09330 [Vicinamibacteria bacterium]|nr:hypothetical protein [Vicinamibacteria bacterium]